MLSGLETLALSALWQRWFPPRKPEADAQAANNAAWAQAQFISSPRK